MRGELLLKGLAFGFLLAATVGPMWVLCLRRTLASGPLVGLASGLGIALADGFYGAVAAFGLTAISGFLLAHAFWIGLGGAAFLIFLGVKTLFANPEIADTERSAMLSLPRRLPVHARPYPHQSADHRRLRRDLCRPGPGLERRLRRRRADRGRRVRGLGCLVGDPRPGGRKLRNRIGPRLFRAVNIVAGISILGFAAWQLAVLFR